MISNKLSSSVSAFQDSVGEIMASCTAWPQLYATTDEPHKFCADIEVAISHLPHAFFTLGL